MKKYNIRIEGMHCASCASNIERSLKKVNGIKSAAVALLMKKAVIEAEDSVSEKDIKDAVARTGYKVASIN